MSFRDTSGEAYRDIAPKINSKQSIVLHTIKRAKRPVNNQEIADELLLSINTITPRTNELVGLGKVELAFKAVYPKTNRRVCYWRAV